MNIVCFFGVITLFCLTSCHSPIVGQKQDVIIVDCIRKENNFELAKAGLVRVGLGDAYKSDESTLRESYQTRKVKFLEVEKARTYFIKVFNEYIKPFNANGRLASLVKTYPFSPANTELLITFLGQNGTPASVPYIAQIRNEGHTIQFYSYDEKSRCFTQIAKERWEAEVLVPEQQADCQR